MAIEAVDLTTIREPMPTTDWPTSPLIVMEPADDHDVAPDLALDEDVAAEADDLFLGLAGGDGISFWELISARAAGGAASGARTNRPNRARVDIFFIMIVLPDGGIVSPRRRREATGGPPGR